MNRLTFSNIVALLAVGALIVIYFRSKKDTEQALKAVTPQPANTGTQPEPGSRTVNGASATTFLPVVIPAESTTGYTRNRYVDGSSYGNVAAGGGGTSMNNSDPTLNTGGNSGTGTGGGGTSSNPGTF